MSARRSTEHGFGSSSRSATHGFESPLRSAVHGFTLVEMMISLFVFGLLAAAGVALLGFSARSQQAAGERLDEAAGLRRVSSLLTADLAQATTRIPRNAAGAAEVAFYGGTGTPDQPALVFTRRGWDNADAAPRASIQRVEYRLSGGRLERRVYSMLDGTAPGPPATLLRGVRTLALRYRERGEWRQRWDPVRPAQLPDAVEAVIDVRGTGAVRMLFLTGTGDGG